MIEQTKKWKSKFGKEYTDRNNICLEKTDKLYYKNNIGISRTELNNIFLKRLDRNIKILEVGTNVGNQLLYLQRIGFGNLYGIEINDYAIEAARHKTKNINIIKGNALDIPFKDDFFDLVFTSRFLIHIHPNNIERVLWEIYRCSSKYIWGFEYYASMHTEIEYRGMKNLLWKANFCKLYLNLFDDLKIVKKKKIKYLKDGNKDEMFLLEKTTI